MFCKQLNFPSEKTCWVLILVLMRGFLCDRVLAAVFWLLLGREAWSLCSQVPLETDSAG